jgi:hypothetical protein
MWRYLVGGLATLFLVGAGVILFTTNASRRATMSQALAALPQAAPAPAATAGDQNLPLPAPPEADARTREAKRFDRVDHDKDGIITRDEMLTPRRKAFAKLDTNHDGVLSFDEWAIKTEKKFADADADHDGKLTRVEFATTAPKRKAPRARCSCGRQVAAPEPEPSDAPQGREDD